MKANFVANEPVFGSIDFNDLSEDEIIKEIERMFPTYIDIEITEIEVN